MIFKVLKLIKCSFYRMVIADFDSVIVTLIFSIKLYLEIGIRIVYRPGHRLDDLGFRT